MKYHEDYGIWEFEGDEADLVYKHMWQCLMDFSWKGTIEVILRILFKRPPKWYWEI